ncbi:MAG: hypothetical protein HY903_21990 [Deltaproteobacteria bacterium]|nr:hypothetical protein [Deltaproteobacteria bacterium]
MMAQGPEVEILLGLAGIFRRVPLAALAATLHLPLATLRESTSRLVLSFLDHDETPASQGREPKGGVGEGSERFGTVPTVRTVTVPPEKQTVTERCGTVLSEPSDARARETGVSTGSLTAEELAGLLDDAANLAFYKTLVAKTSVEDLRTALAETLSRKHELRGRPGAYFTAVIRRLTHPSKSYV